MGWAYQSMGHYEEAARAWQKEQILGGASQEELAGLSDAAASGKEAYWRWWLDYETENLKQGEDVSPTWFAVIYTELGDRDQALESLEKAFAERGTGLTRLKTHPDFDPLRDDPRFHDLLRRMNLEP